MIRNNFNIEIKNILDTGKIENISIENIDLIKTILSDDEINEKLYIGFCKNYEDEFENDNSFFITKIQDMLYRINLLVNKNLIEMYGVNDDFLIKEVFKNILQNKNIDLYSAVSYDFSDYLIIQEQEIDVRDSLKGVSI